MTNIFKANDVAALVTRINKLTPETTPLWGKMSVSQMLAHVNVSYELAYDNKHNKPGPIMKWILKTFVKEAVVGPKPYKKGSPTAKAFLITGDRNFDQEKARLIDYLHKTQQLGEQHFNGKESHSFGALSSSEWNVMFAKHLEHHLAQFGV